MDFEKEIFNVSEIFYSIQGEGLRAGMPCIFIRLQGCKLRCVWCDTKYALQIGKTEILMTGKEIIEKIQSYNCHFVEFTGGEPLEQPNISFIMDYLIQKGYTVAVETAGYLSIKDLPKDVIKIIDFKAPGSKMEKYNNIENINYLNLNDEIKFVLENKEDYLWAKNFIQTKNLESKVNTILLSPVFGKLTYAELAEMILSDSMNVRMQIQMHKHIWHPDTRGV